MYKKKYINKYYHLILHQRYFWGKLLTQKAWLLSAVPVLNAKSSVKSLWENNIIVSVLNEKNTTLLNSDVVHGVLFRGCCLGVLFKGLL